MKKIINFYEKKIEKANRFKEIKIRLSLEEDLDLVYSEFFKKLKSSIKQQLEEQKVEEYEGAIMIQVYTKLPRQELRPLKDLIFASVAENLVITKDRFKIGEHRILGITFLKGFEYIDLPLVNLMELVNYPLICESFNIELYDKENLLYKIMMNR